MIYISNISLKQEIVEGAEGSQGLFANAVTPADRSMTKDSASTGLEVFLGSRRLWHKSNEGAGGQTKGRSHQTGGSQQGSLLNGNDEQRLAVGDASWSGSSEASPKEDATIGLGPPGMGRQLIPWLETEEPGVIRGSLWRSRFPLAVPAPLKDELGDPKDQLDLFVLAFPAEPIEPDERFLRGDCLTLSLKEISEGDIQGIGNVLEGFDRGACRAAFHLANEIRREPTPFRQLKLG